MLDPLIPNISFLCLLSKVDDCGLGGAQTNSHNTLTVKNVLRHLAHLIACKPDLCAHLCATSSVVNPQPESFPADLQSCPNNVECPL